MQGGQLSQNPKPTAYTTWQVGNLAAVYALPTFCICLSTFPLPNEDYDWTPAGILKSPESNCPSMLIGLVK
jgi:hypothetical protein